MSNYQLQVLFDRKDRTYQFNELISGRVVLDTQASLDCRKIWIDYGWRTHGKGNEDKGEGGTLDLCLEPVQFRAGEHREYPFRFRVQNGPMTYHGHVLNVDWYVTAHLDRPRNFDIKAKQDFLLITSEEPEEIILGNRRILKYEIPDRSQGIRLTSPVSPDIQFNNTSKILVFTPIIIGGLVWVFIFLAFVMPAMNSSKYPWLSHILFFGVPIVAFFLYSFGLNRILNAVLKRSIEVANILVTPSMLCTGDQVTCRLQFQTKRKVFLDSVTTALVAEEVAVSEGGSDKSTYAHVAYKQESVKSYKENVIAGRLMYFDCVLPVLPGAPATFSASHNDIKWSVKVKITFNHMPSWEKSIPITVLPI